jgi:hypothetical protein
MGKKHPTRRPWTVQLTSLYRADRDDRIVRAYELVLPILGSRPKLKHREEESENEAVPTYGHLRPRL